MNLFPFPLKFEVFDLYFDIKKNTQKLILFFGFTGIVWWSIVCKKNFGSYVNIPFTHFIPYISFFIVMGLSLYNWFKIFRLEKNIMELDKGIKKEQFSPKTSDSTYNKRK